MQGRLRRAVRESAVAGPGFHTSLAARDSPESVMTVSGTSQATGGRLFRGVTAVLASEIAARALSLGSMLVVARLLGPAALGQLAIAQAVVGYAGIVGDGGLTTLTQRSMVRDPVRAPRLVATTTSIQLALAALLVIAMLGASSILPIDKVAQHLVVVLSPLIVMQAINLFYVLQAREQFSQFAIVRTLGQVATSILSVTLVIVLRSNTWVAVSIWTGALLADLFCFGALHSNGFRLRLPDWNAGKQLLRSGWPYLAIALLSWALQHFDVLVIGATRSSQEAGQYTAAYRIVLMAVGLAALVHNVVFPEMIRRFRNDLPAFCRFLTALIRQSTRVGYAVAALVAVAGPQIVGVIYGSEFRRSGILLAVLFLSVPLSYSASLMGQGLIAAGRERSYLANIIVTAAATIVALLILVPSYGTMAAAGVVLGGELITVTLFTLQFARSLHFLPTRDLLVQLPWLVMPALSLWGLTMVWHRPPLYSMVAVWLVSVSIVELVSGRRLYHETIGLGRQAGKLREFAPRVTGRGRPNTRC